MSAPRERVFNVPAIVLAIIAAIGLVHAVFVLALTPTQENEFLNLFAFIPARYDFRVLSTASWAIGGGAAVWTFVTYAFIHGNLIHLGINAVWLLAFGTPVARRFGPLRFTIFFGATAAAGAAAHLATHFGQHVAMVGASAAISGTLAAATRFAFQRGGPLGALGRGGDGEAYRVPALPLSGMLGDPRVLAFLAVWFGLNLLFGLGTVAAPGMEQGIAWQAHIGGFLTGLFCFALFDPVRHSVANGEQEPPERETPL